MSQAPTSHDVLSPSSISRVHCIEPLIKLHSLSEDLKNSIPAFVRILVDLIHQHPQCVVVLSAQHRVVCYMTSIVIRSIDSELFLRPLYSEHAVQHLKVLSFSFHLALQDQEAQKALKLEADCADLSQPWHATINSLRYTDDVQNATTEGLSEFCGLVRAVGPPFYFFKDNQLVSESQKIRLLQLSNFTALENRAERVSLPESESAFHSPFLSNEHENVVKSEEALVAVRKRFEQARIVHGSLSRHEIVCELSQLEVGQIVPGQLISVIGNLELVPAYSLHNKDKKRSSKVAANLTGSKHDCEENGIELVSILRVLHVTVNVPLWNAEQYKSTAMTQVLVKRSLNPASLFHHLTESRLHQCMPRFVDSYLRALLLLALTGASPRSLPAFERSYLHVLLVIDKQRSSKDGLRLLSSLAQCAPRTLFIDGGEQCDSFPLFPTMHFNIEPGSLGTKRAASCAIGIESGAVTMCDQGTLLINNLDMLQLKDQIRLVSSMQSSEILASTSESKQGFSYFDSRLYPARSSIIAVCGTQHQYYDESKTLGENVDLPRSLLRAFDVVFRSSGRASYISLDATLEDVHRFETSSMPVHKRRCLMVSETSATCMPLSDSALLTSQQMTTLVNFLQSTFNPELKSEHNDAAWAILSQEAENDQLSYKEFLSLVRLASARARFDWTSQIQGCHVQEAIALFRLREQICNLGTRLQENVKRGGNGAAEVKITKKLTQSIWKSIKAIHESSPSSNEDNSYMLTSSELAGIVQKRGIGVEHMDQIVEALSSLYTGQFLKTGGGWNVRFSVIP